MFDDQRDDYASFLDAKSQLGGESGFAPVWMPDFLFDFQVNLVDWALRKGRAAIFADCGMGKCPIALVWAENVCRHESGRVLIITPLSVSSQTVREGEKFGIDVQRSRDGKPMPRITVTNYERLHLFNPSDFVGVVCDESSAIKNFDGARQQTVTQFMAKTPYRLLCTATAAPNDYIELGTSAEALGELGRMDMLSRFFKNDENSLHPIWWGARWRLKPHGEMMFWRWVCSWARAVRKPSDLGFDDGKFVLPPLSVRETVVRNHSAFRGFLFPMEALNLQEQREERRITIKPRCEEVARIVQPYDLSVIWCHLNAEGDLLEKLVPHSIQISGADEDEKKEMAIEWFQGLRCICSEPLFSDKLTTWRKTMLIGSSCICGHLSGIRRLISKPVILGFGLNLQMCAHMVSFPSHSFEQYYQSVRRFWRFGQTNPVQVDIVTTEGESGVVKNLQRKADQAEAMFQILVAEMNRALRIERKNHNIIPVQLPSWL